MNQINGKLLNYAARNEVYNEVQGLPKLRGFTPDNSYWIINEILVDMEFGWKGDTYIVPGIDGLLYLVVNDSGQICCVPHIYFNPQPNLLWPPKEDAEFGPMPDINTAEVVNQEAITTMLDLLKKRENVDKEFYKKNQPQLERLLYIQEEANKIIKQLMEKQ